MALSIGSCIVALVTVGFLTGCAVYNRRRQWSRPRGADLLLLAESIQKFTRAGSEHAGRSARGSVEETNVLQPHVYQ